MTHHRSTHSRMRDTNGRRLGNGRPHVPGVWGGRAYGDVSCRIPLKKYDNIRKDTNYCKSNRKTIFEFQKFRRLMLVESLFL